jgi:repressor of nif and glnA expression
MSNQFMATMNEHLRITVLRLLEEESDFSLNESIINDLSAAFGFSPSRDRLRTELSWLEEQGLVENEDMGGLIVATLTQRGKDVATGRVIVPGVKRPNPRL